jgi:SNF2 family DNA or RNA helicase/uncharacterized Zn finger protein
MAQTFGKTWWGLQWLNALNNIDYSNRLPRGSSYARKGAVVSIDINKNRINAKVAGSRPQPYQVDIILPPFFEPELSNFIGALAKKPVIISKLLNRSLEPEVLTMAEQNGLKVFPKQWTDFKMQCSCPDWAVPCKHLAAVIYKVSTEIDNNPFLVFSLHQLDLIAELNKRGIFVNKEKSKIPEITELYFDTVVSKKTIEPFNNEMAFQKPSYTLLKPIHEPLISLLSDFPVFYQNSGNFKEKYYGVIHRSVRQAQKIIQGKTNMHVLLKRAEATVQHINTHSNNKVIIDKNYQSKVFINETSFSFTKFLEQIALIPNSKTFDYQPSTAALHTVFYTAIHLLANGAVVPQIVHQTNKGYMIRWLPALISKEVRMVIEKLNSIVPPAIFLWEENLIHKEINKETGVNLLSLFLTELIAILEERNSDDIFLNLFFRKLNYSFDHPGEEELSGGIYAWLQKYFLTQGNYKPQIVVEETTSDKFLITINILEKSKALDAPIALRQILTLKKYEKQKFEILQSLIQLSSFIKGLDNYINTKGDELIVMDSATFTPFLFEMIPAIQLLDIDILLPKGLQEILKPKTSLKLKKKTSQSFIRLDQLLDFDWQIAIGDSVMSKQEFEALLKKSEGLIKYKTNYIYVNKEELEKIYKHLNADHTLTSYQMLRAAITGEYLGAKIHLTDEVNEMIKELTNVKEIPLPKGIKATLRPYQIRGYSWMYRNSKIGFGSVLADDMGLGKTLQVICTILKYKQDGLLKDKKVLVIAPTGLITNWQAEIEKFAPKLKSSIYHGTNRQLTKGYDVLLTSYGIMRSDAATLKKLPWHTVVIDEAQNIKNTETGQSKAVKSLSANNFIAMSGTPVENRLSELWSIFDFSNRGFLGNLKEFSETFSTPIETFNDKNVAERLKKATSPFLMRRLKSDKTIISDLPDKIEIDCYGTLVKEQASLYQKTLEKALNEIERIDTSNQKGLFVRQGLVLQMILALKQICNHPTQFLKNNKLDAGLSGKLVLLFDKLDSIVDSNEKVLLFTQFTEMGKMLQHFITERYKVAPLFYHGGSTIKDRKKMVDSFQTNHADKIFILSLKAAGTGLNLTAANHVIHYDLWWNPAVEAQATDRAYRIGQKNNVMVHRFITKNTFEERINEMIQSKKALAQMTVATGENWIGNMSNKELKDLFALA